MVEIGAPDGCGKDVLARQPVRLPYNDRPSARPPNSNAHVRKTDGDLIDHFSQLRMRSFERFHRCGQSIQRCFDQFRFLFDSSRLVSRGIHKTGDAMGIVLVLLLERADLLL